MTDTVTTDTIRKLATVRVLCDPQPMDKADFICVARCEGWTLVVNKTAFGFDALPGLTLPDGVQTPDSGWKPVAKDDLPTWAGELAVGSTACIFFEPDTVLDKDNPEFSAFDKYNRRIKTQKIRKVISQGLAVPLHLVRHYGVEPRDLELGQDLTAIMRCAKYVAAEEAGQYATQRSGELSPGTAPFPEDSVPKTDEANLQSNTALWTTALMANRVITVTEKQDGSSMTINHETICGRNFQWLPLNDAGTEWAHNAQPYVSADAKFKLRDKLKARFERTGEGIWLQCEIVGPKLNGNRLGLEAVDVRVFNVYASGAYLPHERVMQICDELGVPSVPMLHLGVRASELPYKTVKDWLDAANKRMYGKDKPAEGLVIKTDDHGTAGPRVSFKVISPEYLVKVG